MTSKGFKLQPVLDYRVILEGQARQLLAETLSREAALVRKVEQEREELASLHDQLMDKQKTGISVQDLLLYEAGISHKGQLVRDGQRRLEMVRNEIAEKRRQLLTASRDRQLLDKLKEKKGVEAAMEQRRRETVLLDEIALQGARGRA